MTSFVNRYTSAGVETGGRARQSRNCLGFASTYDAHHTAAPLHVRASGERGQNGSFRLAVFASTVSVVTTTRQLRTRLVDSLTHPCSV